MPSYAVSFSHPGRSCHLGCQRDNDNLCPPGTTLGVTPSTNIPHGAVCVSGHVRLLRNYSSHTEVVESKDTLPSSNESAAACRRTSRQYSIESSSWLLSTRVLISMPMSPLSSLAEQIAPELTLPQQGSTGEFSLSFEPGAMSSTTEGGWGNTTIWIELLSEPFRNSFLR